MKKSLLLLALISGLLFCGNNSVNALEDTKTYTYNNKNVTGKILKSQLCSSTIGDVTFPESLIAGNVDIELYCVYSNRDAVLQEINEKYTKTLNFVKTNYDIIEDLNNDNWQEYRNAMINVSVDYPNVDSVILYEIATIDAAFDIYENNEINNQIISLVEQYNILSFSITNSNSTLEEELDSIIPSYSENFGTFKKIQTKVGSTLNVTKATEYAIRHATSRNSNYHSFTNGDCTNFVSQILEYSGVQQVVYESEHSGWWHTNNKILGVIDNHKHSRSWTVADTFSRYMGVTVNTTDIVSWAKGLSEGDFIALDKTNDGSWDHMGYVTKTASTNNFVVEDPINMVCYNIPDIKIAQHTSDYHEWLSTSTNGWETYYRTGAYGRIRG